MKLFNQQVANMGSLISALYREDWEMMGRSLVDMVIEPQRACLIPFLSQVKKAAYEAGALTCSISGAGPAIFTFAKGKTQIENIGRAMVDVMNELNIPHDLHISKINQKGSIVLEGK